MQQFNDKFFEIFLQIFLNSVDEKVLTSCSVLLEKFQKSVNFKDTVVRFLYNTADYN